MTNMETKLSVRDLKISFRTSNGKVQAVRDISFDLAKGETLAIVGESGSGKSVTSKAILGIQAANAITEAGEIIYDGQDLLKIDEEAFHKIRGDKIAMIFQDPMSSLNPLIKIGRQLTEAMILKGKARQKESKNNFNAYLEKLNAAMAESNGKAPSKTLNDLCKKLNQFEMKHTELESAYNIAHEAAVEALEDINTITFEMEKNSVKDVVNRINDIAARSKNSVHEYVVSKKADRLKELAGGLRGKLPGKKDSNYSAVLKDLYEIRDILAAVVDMPAPDFFALGYYVTFAGKDVSALPVDKSRSELEQFHQMNEQLQKYVEDNFLKEFMVATEKAKRFTAGRVYTNMGTAINALKAALPVYAKATLDKKESYDLLKSLEATVKATIDPLAIAKDSAIYTFVPALKSELNKYFDAFKGNVKAQKIHDRDQRKYDRIVAKGKTPDWQVAAASIVDQDLCKSNMAKIINRLIEHYEAELTKRDNRDFNAETHAAIDYLKSNASGIVNKVTKRIAKDRAIKLMEEVGIAEPHRRYNQYPFEFSGGMRQRIVIAIALAANPDILICDEPTTALDVTIQSQILELINKLKKERQLSVIFITHDLGVVANMADRVAVMYAGKIVEYGSAEEVFYSAAHPYTWALLSSMPDLDTDEKLEAIPGTPPNMIYPPVGDAFAARNKYAMQIDFEKQPPMFKISDTHYAATWLLHPDAPKVEPPKIIVDRIARMKAKRGDDHAE